MQAVVQMQERLQQQVEQVDSLLEQVDGHNPPACLIQQATQLQVNQQVHLCLRCSIRNNSPAMFESRVCALCAQREQDAALGGVRSRCEELRSSAELQQQYEQLVHSLEELLTLGFERLTRQPDTELHSRAQLQQQLSRHMVSHVCQSLK